MLEILNKTGGNISLLDVKRTKTGTVINGKPVLAHQTDENGEVVELRIDNEAEEKKLMGIIEGRYPNAVFRLWLETGKLVIKTGGKTEVKKVKKGSEVVEVEKFISGTDIMEGKHFEKSRGKWSLVEDEAIPDDTSGEE